MVSESVFTYRGIVYPWHCDHMGHMNVMWYAGKFDEASWQLLFILGLTSARFKQHGVAVAAVEQHVEYKRELHAGDAVTIRSSILEIRDKSIRLRHEMTDDETGQVAAVAVLVGVFLDEVTRKARSLPADVRDRALFLMEAGSSVAATAFNQEIDTSVVSSTCASLLDQ